MPNRDLTSDLTSVAALKATISGNATTSGADIDTLQFCQGVNFLCMLSAFTDGSYAVNIQESDTAGSGYTDVAAAQLIGSEPTLTAAIAQGGTVSKVGCFGTKRYVRAQVVSTGVTTGATAVIVAQQVADVRP